MQSKFLILILLLFIPKSIISSCSNGCLSCSSLGQCQLCDNFNFFFLNSENGNCEYSFIENCFQSTEKEICQFCKKDYFWNSSSKECELSQIRIRNCFSYDDQEQCILCEANYSLINNECIFNFKQIGNCTKMNDEGSLCEECQPGFFLDSSGKKCIPFDEGTNCLISSNFFCSECDLNYFPNMQNNFYSNLNASQITLFANVFQSSQFQFWKFEQNDFDLHDYCLKTNISHCQHLASIDKCQKCAFNFILDETSSTCHSQIFPKIDFCEEYYSFGNCKICQNGYFLASSSECKAVLQIDNCVEYANMFDGCQKCAESFYLDSLSANNSCVERIEYPIKHCGNTNLFVLTIRELSPNRRQM